MRGVKHFLFIEHHAPRQAYKTLSSQFLSSRKKKQRNTYDIQIMKITLVASIDHIIKIKNY